VSKPETTNPPLTLGAVLYGADPGPLVHETQWLEWLREIAAGDPRALRDLFETTQDVVFTFISRIVEDRQTAEALTVEVFHDVWRHAAQFDPASGSVLGWIMRYANFTAINHVRLRQYSQATRLTDPFGPTGAVAETFRTVEG
jgi:RNA polymerase sigma-70 factor, ECF subfamily